MKLSGLVFGLALAVPLVALADGDPKKEADKRLNELEERLGPKLSKSGRCPSFLFDPAWHRYQNICFYILFNIFV